MRLKINHLLTLLLIIGLTACSTSDFHRQKYTRFGHGKTRDSSAQQEKKQAAGSEVAQNDTVIPTKQLLTTNAVLIETNAGPVEHATVAGVEQTENDLAQTDAHNDEQCLTTIPDASTAPTLKKDETGKTERKIRRTSITAYSFLLAFGLLTAMFFLAGVSKIMISETLIFALWFLSPAALVTAIVLVTVAFFKGRNYMARKKAAGEAPAKWITRLHMTNKILLFICGLAALGVVAIFLLELSSI